MRLDPCGCCEPLSPATPLAVENRPGLSAIAYRVGTYASFRQSMLQAIAGTPELAALGTRLSDDHAITLLELWATVADVLAFYQERIANEGFLRTARLRDSVLRLARLIDYQLGPGAAATALLAFTLEKGATVKIPVGLRVQSVPGQDEKPQKFETLEAVAADARLNRLRVLPSPIGVNPVAKGSVSAYLVPGPDTLNLAKTLVPGDHVVLFGPGANSHIEELEVGEVRVEDDRVVIVWARPVQAASLSIASQAFKLVRKLHAFGHDAPPTYVAAVKDPAAPGGVRWMIRNTHIARGPLPAPTDRILLDRRYDDLAVGTRLLVSTGDGQGAIRSTLVTVTAVGEAQAVVGPMSGTTTRVTISPTVPASLAPRILIYELGPAIPFWGYAFPEALTPTTVFLPGRRLGPQRIDVGSGIEIDPREIELGRRVLLHDARRAVGATIKAASLVASDVVFGATPADAATVVELGLSADASDTLTGLLSAVLEPFPPLTREPPQLSVTIGRVASRILTLPGKPVGLVDASTWLEVALRTADPSPAFAKAEVRIVDGRLLVLPGVAGTRVTVAPTPDDATSAGELGLDSESGTTVTALASASLAPFPKLTAPAPELSVTIGVIGPRRITLTGPLTGPLEVATRLRAALNAADVAPAFSHARVHGIGGRLLVLPGIVGRAAEDFLRLDLEPDSEETIAARSAVLLGNVARASHGETVKDEVLGDGDAAATFQRLVLKKKPLTHVPSAGAGGLESTLRVLVHRVLWRQVPSLYGQGPDAQVYTTRIADDGTVTVHFGDGVTGARTFSGRGNVTAIYRHGLGLAGRVRAATLTTLLDRPIGLRSATNPLPADGGADPETLDEARENAPSTVRTFDRAVSLRDFEDLVAASGEVARARATWVWTGDARAVHLTVAGQEGGIFSADALRRIHASLTARRDPNHALLIDNVVRVPIVIGATLHVAPTHVAADVESAARAALLAALSFETLAFGQPIHLSDVYRVLQGVPGVVWVKVDLLHFQDRSAAHLAARGADAEPVQEHLRIHAARPAPQAAGLVLPAEQAWIDAPTRDVTLLTSGGLPL